MTGQGSIVPHVRRIAVLRANAVGDFIVALPALCALRSAYPGARLTLLGRAWHAAFLAGRPGPVDDVVVLPAIEGITAAPDATTDHEAQASVVQALVAQRFDLALQLHGGGRHSNPWVRRLNAGVTAGFQAADALPLDRNLPYVDDHHPAALHLLECVSLVGACAAPLEPRLALRPTDRSEAQALLPEDGRPLVVLQPGASHPHKRWSPARFAALGDALAARGARIALNGSAGEADLTKRVAAAMRHPACDLAGRLSLGGLAGVLSRAALLVSNDTGPVHLARAMGTPTVAIFWVGNVRSFGPLTTATQRVATSWRMTCPRCGRNAMTEGCTHDVSLVDDVSVEEVLALADSLWEGAAPGRARAAAPPLAVQCDIQ